MSAYGVPYSARLMVVRAVRAVEKNLVVEKSARTIKCPNGKTVRDSAVAIAHAMMAKPRGGFPKIEFRQSPNPPIKAMDNADLLAWAAKALREEPGVSTLIRSLRRVNVTGETMISMCQTKYARTGRFSCYGIPLGMRLPLVKAVRAVTTKEDVVVKEVPKWIGRLAILIDDDMNTEIRDSPCSIDTYYP